MPNTYMRVALAVAMGILATPWGARGAKAPIAKAASKSPVLTHDGVGPIHKDLPMDKPWVLKRMFKGCRLSSTVKMMDRKPNEKIVAVTCHGTPYYRLHAAAPNLQHIASAEVTIPGAKSPEGIAIGQTLGDVYKLGQVDCDADVNPARVRCVFLGDTAIAYSATDTTKEANGLLPSEADIKNLKITGIVWRAYML